MSAAQNPHEAQHIAAPGATHTVCGLDLDEIPNPPSDRWPFCKACRAAGGQIAGGDALAPAQAAARQQAQRVPQTAREHIDEAQRLLDRAATTAQRGDASLYVAAQAHAAVAQAMAFAPDERTIVDPPGQISHEEALRRLGVEPEVKRYDVPSHDAMRAVAGSFDYLDIADMNDLLCHLLCLDEQLVQAAHRMAFDRGLGE